MASADIFNADILRVEQRHVQTLIDVCSAEGTVFRDTPMGEEMMQHLLTFTFTIQHPNEKTASEFARIVNQWVDEGARFSIQFKGRGPIRIRNEKTGAIIGTHSG